MTIGFALSLLGNASAAGFGYAAAGAAVRSAVALAAVWAFVAACPRLSAARRHFAWVVGCGVALAMPALQGVVPAWRVEVSSRDPGAAAPAIVGRRDWPAVLARAYDRGATPDHPRGGGVPRGRSGVGFAALLAIWGAGTLVVAAEILRSRRRVRRLLAETAECDSAHVLAAARDAAALLGVRGVVPVRYHADAMPMVCGVWSPVVVLPIAAAGWTRARLFDVVLHELAHVARRDAWTQALAAATCAAYWFNPLAWAAARALRAEREVACDDRVLAAGARPTRYATHLLDLARAYHAPPAAAVAALAFARPAHLRARLVSIVDPRRARAGVTTRYAAVGTAIAAAIVYPLAALTPARGHPHPFNQEMNTMQRRAMTTLAGAVLGAANPVAGRAQATDTFGPARILDTTRTVTKVLVDSVQAGVTTLRVDSVRRVASITSVNDLLESRVPGLTVQRASGVLGDTTRIRIRGPKSITGSNDPVVVVDGVRVYADSSASPLGRVDPNTIEKIEVLIGPTATKLYGADAGNRMIIITTKKDKSAADTGPRK